MLALGASAVAIHGHGGDHRRRLHLLHAVPVGNCVVGIATQDPEHEARYQIDVQLKAIARFFEVGAGRSRDRCRARLRRLPRI